MRGHEWLIPLRSVYKGLVVIRQPAVGSGCVGAQRRSNNVQEDRSKGEAAEKKQTVGNVSNEPIQCSGRRCKAEEEERMSGNEWAGKAGSLCIYMPLVGRMCGSRIRQRWQWW